MLRNMLGPVFNLYLDQFLTYNVFFFLLFCFLFGWTPICIVFSAKMQNLEKHKFDKKKKKDTICEHNCANCSCQNVRFVFFLHFSVLLFLLFPFLSEIVFDRFPKIQKYKSNKNKKKNNNTRTQDAKEK